MNQWATIYHIVIEGFQRGRLWLAIILAVSAAILLVAAFFKLRQYPTPFIIAALIWVLVAGALVVLTVALNSRPYILVATLAGLEQRGKGAGLRAGTYLQLNVSEAFYLDEAGQGEALPEKMGELELVTNETVYQTLENYAIGDEAIIVALGTHEAIGVVTADHYLIMANGTHDLVTAQR